ncbi:MAG: hypothetical protein KAR20_00580 [Candidatus Heimdallarchaeota archaeon]|nr:hypothetical protein [Candidatus Heimdallarchaeota archaeon]
MSTKFKQGMGPGRGITRNEIINFVMHQKDNTAFQSDIKDHLREKLNIREHKGIKTHLDNLVNQNIFLDLGCDAGKSRVYSIVKSIDALMQIIEYIDSKDMRDLMSSEYYQTMVPQLVTFFEDSLPHEEYTQIKVDWEVPTEDDMKDNVEYLRDTCNLKLKTTGSALSPEDRMNITESLKSSISALKFVLHFGSLDENSRQSLILNIECDLIDPQYTPDAAHKNGYMECIEDMEISAQIPEDILKSIFANMNKKRQDEPVYFWSSFFNMLDKFGSHYPFLFE